MKLTSGKLRYLLTIDSLEKSLPRVRCIDVAVQLGISRASVCKMLSSLTKEGLLEQLPGQIASHHRAGPPADPRARGAVPNALSNLSAAGIERI